jgi:opacity protein-like surface antigen
MRRLILVFSALLALLIYFEANSAFADEGHHTLGVEGGQVGQSGDVSTLYGNALGYGAFFKYAASDFLEVEFEYLHSQSNQNNLNHNQNSLGLTAIWDLDVWDIFVPYLKGGAEFVSASNDYPSLGLPATGVSANGFGLDVGLGAAVLLGNNFMTGLDFTYHDIFDVSVTPPGYPNSVKAIQPYWTVLLQIGFMFGGGK